MKKILFVLTTMALLCGCAGHTHENADSHDGHVHMHSFTAYTHEAELFLQHEGLEVGKKACITLYVTTLSDFKPSQADEANLLLRVGGKSHTATAHAHGAGMFHFELVPETAGAGTLYITIGEETAHFDVTVTECCESHDHGDAHNHGHNHDAHSHDGHNHAGHNHEGHDHSGHSHGHSHAPHPGHGTETPAKEGDVSFAKEQSWKIDFATAEAKESYFGGAVKVAAKVVAAPSDFTTIVAAASGKVQFAGNVVEGKGVTAGEALFYLEGGDVTDNDAAVKFAEAESNYLLAKADYERKKLLFGDKVVSEREYQAAEAAYVQAGARFTSMKRSFGSGKVTLKAPKNGYIASLLVSNGDYVEPGTPIATVQSNGSMNIAAELPVRFAQQLKNIEDVNIVLASGEAFSMNAIGGKVLAVGSSANSCNMLPLTISAGAFDGAIPGSIVTLYIISKSNGHAIALPRTALVEEMGNFFVFVQNNPASFEKRAVEVGATDGIRVEITKGVHAGERVVTKGAVALKLSQGAAALDPHAGHVH